jgi:Spy/CpxP family protein refolding chaperone
MTITRAVVGAMALALCASVVEAQRPNRSMPGRGGQQPGRPDGRREDLEDEVRRNFARAVRERVGLTDDQMLKLGPITRKFEDQRRQVQRDERDARTKLMGLVMINAEADSVRIRQHISEMNEVRRRRMQIDEAEQKDLAGIMTPLQLAKFLALQENVRRRLEQARPFPGGPPNGPPPGGAAPRNP